jgi:hypothetical protein
MRHTMIVFVSTLLLLLVSAEAWADITLPGVPAEAERCTLIQVTLQTDEGHEWSTIHTKGLRLVGGWFHHYEWNQSVPGRTIGGTSVLEWSMNWNGPPTWEFEVIGGECTKAEVYVSYIGGSYGVPTRYTETKEITILPAGARLELTNEKGDDNGDGVLLIDGNDSVKIRAVLRICDKFYGKKEVTFTTNLGIIGKTPHTYSQSDLLAGGQAYLDLEEASRTKGVTVKTDDNGVAEVYLTAHSPVIGEVLKGREGDIRLWNERNGTNHGQSRTAQVTATAKFGKTGVVTQSISVTEEPGTDLKLLLTTYWTYRDNNPMMTGLTESLQTGFWSKASHVVSAINKSDARGGPTSLSTGMQAFGLKFLLDTLSDPEYAQQIDGYDFAPVVCDLDGVLFKAVVIYARGSSWLDGEIIDPMWENEHDPWYSVTDWPPHLLAGTEVRIDDDPAFANLYPATGGYVNSYPRPADAGKFKPAMTLTTLSPVRPLLQNSDGLRSGVLADGTVVQEIPDTILIEMTMESGDKKYLLETEDTSATITILGIDDGTFGATLTRVGADGIPRAAAWRDVPVANGEAITAVIGKNGAFVPLIRPGGTEIWPIGSASFGQVKAKIKINAKKSDRDSVSLKAVWLNGEKPFDFAGSDLVIHFGDLEVTVPAGMAKVSSKGDLSYKAVLSGGAKLKVKYGAKKGKLSVSLGRTNLATFEPGDVVFECVCGDSEGTGTVRLHSKGSKLVTK